MAAVVDAGTCKQCRIVPFRVSRGKLQTCLKVCNYEEPLEVLRSEQP